MTKKIKVIHGGDFRDRWNNIYVSLDDYESLSGEDYEQKLFDLFEYGFSFDESKHEYCEAD